VYSNVTFCFSFWGTQYPGCPTGVLRWTPLGTAVGRPQDPLIWPPWKITGSVHMDSSRHSHRSSRGPPARP